MATFRVFFIRRSTQKARVEELKAELLKQLPNFPLEDVTHELPDEDNWQELATGLIASRAAVVCRE